ncbi:MAG: hypothetical protein ABI559_03800 [Chloroflexota bacterium]
MRLLLFLPLLAAYLTFVACHPDHPLHENDHPCGFDPTNPAIVLYCTNTPEPTRSPDPTPTPTPGPQASRTPLSNNTGAWLHQVGEYSHQLRDASDNAASAFPDFASNPGSMTEYAAQYSDVTGRIVGGVDRLAPPPAGLESQYQAFDSALHTLNTALQASPPDASAIAAAQTAYVNACTALQQYDDSSNLGDDLRCSGETQALGPAAFFAALTPAIATLHTKADSVQSTFDALPTAQQADLSALTVYVTGIGNAYGNAALSLADPVAPADLAAKQQAMVDAANAVFNASPSLQNDIKNATDLSAEVAAAKSTLAPLQAAVETACADLQAAATSAGVTTSLGCR